MSHYTIQAVNECVDQIVQIVQADLRRSPFCSGNFFSLRLEAGFCHDEANVSGQSHTMTILTVFWRFV